MKPSVLIEIGMGHTAWIHGRAHIIHPVLRQVRSPRQYDPKRRAIAIPAKFVDDVMAALELRAGVDVQVEQVLG